ncbi:MAG: hypothetical protein AMXMBFR58_36670 [Phycisphaerae bacterium]
MNSDITETSRSDHDSPEKGEAFPANDDMMREASDGTLTMESDPGPAEDDLVSAKFAASPVPEFLKALNLIDGSDIDPAAVPETQIRAWVATTETHREQSFLRGYLIGRALKAQKATIKHGQKEAWARSRGLAPQSVNGYIRGFEAIEQALQTEAWASIPAEVWFTKWVRRLGSKKTGEPPKPTATGALVAAKAALVKLGALDSTVESLATEVDIKMWIGVAANNLCTLVGRLTTTSGAPDLDAVLADATKAVAGMMAASKRLKSTTGNGAASGTITAVIPANTAAACSASTSIEVTQATTALPSTREPIQSLPVRLRPTRFADVLGNADARRVLLGAVIARNVGPFLLLGPAGTGKSALAGIFARAWLCLAPVAGEPCRTCTACKEGGREWHIVSGGSIAVIGAGDQPPADTIQRVLDAIHHGAETVIVNEADLLLREQRSLLTVLESPKLKAPIVFTAVGDEAFQRHANQFPSRLTVLKTELLPDEVVVRHMQEVYRREVGRDGLAEKDALAILDDLKGRGVGGQMRDVLRALDAHILREKAALLDVTAPSPADEK